jgi:hypothetical protein
VLCKPSVRRVGRLLFPFPSPFLPPFSHTPTGCGEWVKTHSPTPPDRVWGMGKDPYPYPPERGRGFPCAPRRDRERGEGEGTGESPPVYSKSAGTRLERPPPEALRLPSPIHRKVTGGVGRGDASRLRSGLPRGPAYPLASQRGSLKGGANPFPCPPATGQEGVAKQPEGFPSAGCIPSLRDALVPAMHTLYAKGVLRPEVVPPRRSGIPPFGSGAREVPLLAARKHPRRSASRPPPLSPPIPYP